MAPEALEATRQEIAAAAEAAGRSGADVASLSEIERAVLGSGVPGVTVRGDRVMTASAHSAELSAAARRVLSELEASPWAPPEVPLADRGALRELERAGLVRAAGELWFSSRAVDAAEALLAGLLVERPEGITVSTAREALGTTRKYVMPLLAHFDATGVTRRRGDVRIAGPRLRPAKAPENAA
jgi:selenocysteine-specific elongation factor